jgi:Tat protein secretion system quality control protein TatD with DNase activity
MTGENNGENTEPFPWELGVFDAHCHPTDTMTSIAAIPHMKVKTLTVMSTRGEDQDLVVKIAFQLGSEQIIPCFGWHPWFAHRIQDDTTDDSSRTSISKSEHYRQVLTGSSEDDESFFQALPDPIPLSTLLSDTRKRLLEHPTALVGEVGLDRAFRLPVNWKQHEIEARDFSLTPGSREGRQLSSYRVVIGHQKALLKTQLQLAGRLHRAASVHSVQAHGAVFEVLSELWKGHERKQESRRQRRRRSAQDAHADQEQDHGVETDGDKKALPFPPRICMHSYSGPTEALKQFLRPAVPSDVYFSFSTVINFSNSPADKVVEVIKSLPDDRILVESDLHCAGQQMDDLLEAVVRTICQIRGWQLDEGIKQLADNYKRFVFG